MPKDLSITNFILPFLWSAIISLYAVPSVVELAWEKGLMDSFEKRKIHHLLTPRLGGVAIFAGTFSGILIFTRIDNFLQYFLVSILLLFFLGVKDDLNEIKTWKKLIVQILATSLLIYESEFMLTSFKGLLGFDYFYLPVQYALTIIYIVAVTNAINFIDGLDGLAASIGVIISLILGFYLLRFNSMLAIACICLGGSLLGFLRYNIKESAVFMGDSGSLITGFMVAVLSLSLMETTKDASGIVIAFSLLMLPVTDLVRVVFLRIFQRTSPFTPGRDHIHHILIDSGFTKRKTLLIILSITSFSSLTGIAMVSIFHFDPNRAIFVLFVFSILITIYCEFKRRSLFR